MQPVTIPGTPLRIQGRIDRLDLSEDGRTARLVDYKTGKPKDTGVLAGLRDGHALFGPDTGGSYDDMAFALLASPGALTERKREAARKQLGNVALIWDEA